MTEHQPQQECPPPRTSEAVDCWLRKWGRNAAVDGKEPLTREDVERLIEANGGTGDELELRQRDMQGADLYFAKLEGAFLRMASLQGANLTGANLQGAHLEEANLQSAQLRRAGLQGAYLTGAELQDADLEGTKLQDARLELANLQGTNLFSAKFQGAYLNDANLQDANLGHVNLHGADIQGIHISRETNLEGVIWHKGYVLPSEDKGYFGATQSTYRALKTWHQEHGFYDIAGEFHHREMVCRRKQAQQEFVESCHKTKNPWRLAKSLLKARWSDLAHALVMAFYEQLFGYGERPWRVVRAAVAVVLGLALAYYLFGTFAGPVRLIDALYYSAVSFSAVGYGSWVHEPQGWTKYMGVAESYLGVFTIALFLVTFTRKMVR